MQYAPRTGAPRGGSKTTAQRRRDILQWEMDYRFVREVERLEREGVIPSRADLEGDLLMHDWGIARIRNGTVSVSPVQIALFWKLYRCDISFILTGHRIAAPPTSALDPSEYRGQPVWYTYRETARWKIGRRPETHASYYPPDPQNLGWTPQKTYKNISAYEPGQQADNEAE